MKDYYLRIRNEKYDTKIKKSINDKYVSLSTTHNGYQWYSIRIDNPEYEIPRMIKVLEEYLKNVTK